MSFKDLFLEEKIEIINELYSPPFPIWTKNVFIDTWLELKGKGAKVVQEKDIDEESFFLGDGDYECFVYVILYKNKTYDRFLNLVREEYPNADEIISNWKEELRK